jgi:hypothetical protein
VERVDCEQLPYGKAYGYPTVNGIYSDHWEHDKKWKVDKWITSGGSYQWTLVTDINIP